MPESETRHIPVLLDDVIRTLDPRAGDTIVDATAGLGGHAAALARAAQTPARIVLNDFDPANLRTALEAVRAVAGASIPILMLRGNFVDIPRRLREQDIGADILLVDLGFSSNQMDAAHRGFSFMRDGPLDMRLDPDAPRTAADLIRTLPEAELASIVRQYGEEPRARAVAAKLVAERDTAPIDTTSRLAAVLRSVLGSRNASSRIDPVTRTFQALRIAVNDEISNLESLLESISRAAEAIPARSAAAWLNPGARIGFVTFHSLEDRLVKRRFRELADRGLGTPVTRKPIVASEAEVNANPRSRSAKLRVITLAA